MKARPLGTTVSIPSNFTGACTYPLPRTYVSAVHPAINPSSEEVLRWATPSMSANPSSPVTTMESPSSLTAAVTDEYLAFGVPSLLTMAKLWARASASVTVTLP